VPEARERFMMLVKVGRSADRHGLRRDIGMRSRSEKELDVGQCLPNGLAERNTRTGLLRLRSITSDGMNSFPSFVSAQQTT